MSHLPRAGNLLALTSALAAALLLTSLALPASAGPTVGGYTRTVLQTGTADFPDAFRVSTTGNPVNSSGLVAGSTVGGDFRAPSVAALYNVNTGTWTDIGTLRGSADAAAADVNEGGDVVGTGGTDIESGGPTLAFLWTLARPTMYALGSLDAEDPNSGATAINDHGVVVGWTYTPDSGYSGHAFVWDPTVKPVKMRDLGTLGGVDSVAYGINNAGTVVGSATTRRRVVRPVIWSAGQHTVTDIGTLPGYDSGVARDVNDRGYVVGEDFNAANPRQSRAFVWSPLTRTVTALSTPSGLASRATAINYHGVVVGQLDQPPLSGSSGPNTKAVIWNACSPLTVLPENYGAPTGITRRERVVGSSEYGGTSWLKAGPCT
ncbi:hypothetical protein [uncultured Friedmanniella sp.]|uniref:hypothetical protein n=1 Tax=uncultured Friedmanniella sp. TaxID=335381 RepID=UPI0035C9FD19